MKEKKNVSKIMSKQIFLAAIVYATICMRLDSSNGSDRLDCTHIKKTKGKNDAPTPPGR